MCVIIYSLTFLFVAVIKHVNTKVVAPTCYGYTTLTDKTLLTDYNGTADGMTTITPGWYKIGVTDEGNIVSKCPQHNECGTPHQAWLLDSFPSYNKNTSTNVTVCIRGDTNCCVRNITIEMTNCFAYTTYYLIPLKEDERYCFEAEPIKQSQPVTTTIVTTTTANITLPLVQPDPEGPPIALIAAIVAAFVLAVIVSGIVIAAKKRSRNLSRDDPNAYFFRFGVGRHIFDISTLGTDILINPQRLVDLINIDAPLGATRRKFDIRALKHNRRAISASDVETNFNTATTNGFPQSFQA